MNTGTLEDAALQVRAGSSVNGTGTCEKSGTRLTQRRSRRVRKYPATPEQRALIAMCATFGADTPAGHRCSNMGQQLKHYPKATGEQRANLAKEIRQSHDDLTSLTTP